MQVLVTSSHGNEASHHLDLERGIKVGRDDGCDLVLRDPDVSRQHLFLQLHAERLFAKDTSSNGTWIEERRLWKQETWCRAQDTIRVGPYLLRIADTSRADAASNSFAQKERNSLRRKLHQQLLCRLDLRQHGVAKETSEKAKKDVLAAIGDLVEEHRSEIRRHCSADEFVRELADEVLGLGPLEALLKDQAVSEIMVVHPQLIYVERDGRIERTSLSFSDDDAARSVIERVVTPLGRRIDESNPYVDARLEDGSRVHAIIPPLATQGPCITIRKFQRNGLTLERLVEQKSASAEMAEFLRASVVARKNILISGGTGSGKTTLLNLLSRHIARGERVITIEDAAELQLQQEHVVSLESRPPNMEGKGEITIRSLVSNALRMRPDRILVGECRGGEALDMLQAMNTGHEGSMTTTHANNPREALARLETLALMAGLDLPARAIREQIAASIDLVVQQTRLSDGSRKITSITEVLNIDDDGHIATAEIYRYLSGTTERFLATGILPTFIEQLERAQKARRQAAC